MENYVKPVLEIVELETDNVILTSACSMVDICGNYSYLCLDCPTYRE